MSLLIKIVVLGLCLSCAYCLEFRADDGAEDTEQTTSGENADIAEADVDETLNLDVGRYTTQRFQYHNDQFLKAENDYYNDTCIDEHIRCLIGITTQTPVCGYNNPWDRYRGYFSKNTYCDIYFDNCLRGYRVWRLLDYGRCLFIYGTTSDNVQHTLRRWNSNPLIIRAVKAPAAESPNTGLPEFSNITTIRRFETHTETLQKVDDVFQDTLDKVLSSRRSNSIFMTNLLKFLATEPQDTEIFIISK